MNHQCAAKGCVNTRDQGRFVGRFCSPCDAALVTGEAKNGTSWIFGVQAHVDYLEGLLRENNEACQALCGIGDQEAVACGYRPYLLSSGRRCPNCPTFDIIDFTAQNSSEGGK